VALLVVSALGSPDAFEEFDVFRFRIPQVCTPHKPEFRKDELYKIPIPLEKPISKHTINSIQRTS
jgi:hypothetical protein